MRVRPLRPTDAAMARELLRQLGYDMPAEELGLRIERVLAAGRHYAAVAEEGDAVLGLVHAYERPALEKPCEVVVQSLVVDSGSRSMGIGRALMAAAEAWASANGMAQVVLHTRIEREDARAFYERLGYQKAATSHLMSKRVVAA
jgi:ribosomal protein S18 acetylase RimI-like enzyme